jgi:hypothetical protein
MKRLKELIQKVKTSGKDNGFFDNIEFDPINQPLAYKWYRSYELALQCLDSESWNILSAKAIEHFTKNATSQYDFYNHLNEAFGYQHLIQQNYNHVKFFEDNKSKKNKKSSPDLSYQIDEKQFFCEVKSIMISIDERNRSNSGESYDGSVYLSLSDEFFNKLQGHLEKAKTQISMYGEGLIFIFIPSFDDISHMYYSRYREQIIAFITSYEVIEVYIKVGIHGDFIYKKRNGEIIFS